MSEVSRQRPDYERSDVGTRALALLAAGGALFLLVTPLALAAIYPQALNQPRVGVLRQPPPPRLQIDPELDSRPELADRDRAGERRDSESEMPVGEVRIDHVRVV